MAIAVHTVYDVQDKFILSAEACCSGVIVACGMECPLIHCYRDWAGLL